MKTSTRLILFLITLVGAVMLLGGYYSLKQRQQILQTAMQSEVRAHALTLQLMLEDAYRAARAGEAQQFINRLSQNPRVYSVILYDEQGQIMMLTDPLVADEIRFPPEIHQVLASGAAVELVRDVGEMNVFSIIMPVRISETRRGAFEITQPREFIEADFARARRDIALAALTLFAVISLGVLTVLRRQLARPIRELLTGAAAVGQGDLDFRVLVPGGGNEFKQLANAFNRMAGQLNQQRQAAVAAAEDRLRLEQQLLNAERLAALGRLAAGVAHEMGAPLNVIKGRAEQLLAQPATPRAKAERNLTIINEQAEVIARIVRQLLFLGRPVAVQPTPLGAAELVRGVFELLEPEAARADVELQFIEPAPARLSGDRELLQQVLMNICRNGLQAMPDGGTLRVELLPLTQVNNGQHLVGLQISDDGTGIAPEHLHRLFDPFFTTKDVGEGTGLGLSVTRRIIEEHGGYITARNLAEGGAAFTLWLPQAAAPSTNGDNA